MDNLSPPHASQPDPFDVSQFWQTERLRPNYDIRIESTRPNYDFNIEPIQSDVPSISQESHRYATNINTTVTESPYNNKSISRTNSISSNSHYGTTYSNTNALSIERNVPIAPSLAAMSLDDRISESLNLRSKNDLYSNSCYHDVPSTSAGPNTLNNTSAVPINTPNNASRYNDIPIYSNFEINPAQREFLLETKDYYTKLSTPAKTISSNDYEKNIYVPKYEDEAEKLKNFSECLENSKNYSALKYQNVDYYTNYSGYGANAARSLYDEVETASNVYSEIGEASDRNVYTNTGLYDEVYDETPRPHRPAPPCPPPK